MTVEQYTHCVPSYVRLANTIPVTMRFLFTCLWVWLVILRLSPTHYHDLLMTTITGESPETVTFACRVMLDSYAVVAVDWKNSNRLRLKTRGIYRVHPQRLYRVHQPAAVIVTLLLAAGDIESNPGPVQYPCTVCEKPVKRNQRGIMCDSCSQWTHARCGGVEEAEYVLLTAHQSSEWLCPSCVQSKLSISSLSLLDNTTSLMLLQPKIDDSDTEVPGVNKTNLQNSESHSEDRAKKLSAKNRKYYERRKARILANRKQKYSENAEVEKAASHSRYKAAPETQKAAARARYTKNPKIKIGHSKAYYAKNKNSICAKARNKYLLCEPKLDKIETYLQEIQANLLENSKARLALIKVLKEQHKTLAEQTRGVLRKTACRLAAKRLLNKALQVRKEHAGSFFVEDG